MMTFRVRRDDVVVLEDEAETLEAATARAIDATTARSRSDRHDYVLDERVGAAWRPRVTIHPPSRW